MLQISRCMCNDIVNNRAKTLVIKKKYFTASSTRTSWCFRGSKNFYMAVGPFGRQQTFRPVFPSFLAIIGIFLPIKQLLSVWCCYYFYWKPSSIVIYRHFNIEALKQFEIWYHRHEMVTFCKLILSAWCWFCFYYKPTSLWSILILHLHFNAVRLKKVRHAHEIVAVYKNI